MDNKMFYETLPRWGKKGHGKEGSINWIKSAEIKAKVKFIYDDIEGEVEIINYDSKTQYLQIKYLNKPNFKIHIGSFTNCNLGKLLGVITEEFKIEIGIKIQDDKRNMTIINREYRKRIHNDKRYSKKYIINDKWYKYHCNKCGYENWIIESSLLLQSTGCACCDNKVVIEGINDIPTTAPWMIPYFKGGIEEAKKYTRMSGQKIYPICPDCKRIGNKSMSIYTIYKQGISCNCGDGISYPEKFMISVLEQLNAEFEYQYSPDWCEYLFKDKSRKGRYDFCFELNNKKYIIEMDGGLGHGKKTHGKSKLTIEESKVIDDEKDRLANEHEIEVIRIDCEESELEYIKNNILDKLNNLFDISNIDWNKCEEFALSNLCKQACEIKRDNPEITASEISILINVYQSTTISYLKKGSKLGWCNYDAKEEMRKCGRKNGKLGGKQVEIFKNGSSLGVFESCVDLSRQSEKLFGVKLSQGCITAVCRKEVSNHRGYTFKYIND